MTTYGKVANSVPHYLREPLRFLRGFIDSVMQDVIQNSPRIGCSRETQLNDDGVHEGLASILESGPVKAHGGVTRLRVLDLFEVPGIMS